MLTPRTFRATVATVLVASLVTACATARPARRPDLARALQSLLQAPKSVATFDNEFTTVTVRGETYSHYESRGDSTITADVLIRELVAPESGDTAFVRQKAEAYLTGIREDKDSSRGSLTIQSRESVTYQTPKGPVPGYRMRMTRTYKGVSEGVHLYAIATPRRLVAIRAQYPVPRDAASEIERFAEEFAVAMRDADAGATVTAALAPAARIGGFDLIDTHRYPIADAGVQYRYQDSSGLQADLYIYRGDAASFGADKMAALRAEVGSFREGLPLGQKRGYYGSYSIVSDTLLTVRVADRDYALHRIALATTRDGRAQDSYFYLALVGGAYVKVRITQPQGRFPLSRADAFMHAVLEDVVGKTQG